MSKDDGGPAFPCDTGVPVKYEMESGGSVQVGTYYAPHQVSGMSLRDYFAAAALSGLLAMPEANPVTDAQELALLAYELADDMLARRSKP